MYRVKDDISTALSKSDCHLHAYVLMTNHLHFLVTPPTIKSLSIFMQAMANRYVRYFNAVYKRTGTIWEGRYKSCLVDSEHYLFALYRYIELNPVKANMVDEVGDYRWSSYPHNALGISDALITDHPMYIELGKGNAIRQRNYRSIFETGNSKKEDNEIAWATTRGEALGSDLFHKKIGELVSRATKLSSHGGDRKSEKYHDQAG